MRWATAAYAQKVEVFVTHRRRKAIAGLPGTEANLRGSVVVVVSPTAPKARATLRAPFSWVAADADRKLSKRRTPVV